MDVIPHPKIAGIDAKSTFPVSLLIVDPTSRFKWFQGMKDATTTSILYAISQFQADVQQKHKTAEISHIRSDAGSQFLSAEFDDYCVTNRIKHTAAAPKHQEMNAYCESTWNQISTMARSMLVHADLSLHFWYEAHRYAVDILNILPARNLYDSGGNPTTPYFIVNKRKPRIGKFHVFGCPCTFKRYQPIHETRLTTKKMQLQ